MHRLVLSRDPGGRDVIAEAPYPTTGRVELPLDPPLHFAEPTTLYLGCVGPACPPLQPTQVPAGMTVERVGGIP